MAITHQIAGCTIGENSDYFSVETRKKLGDLLVYLLYHEIDKASFILQGMTPEDLATLGNISYKLGELSKVCKKYVFEIENIDWSNS
jgi:hypothetical protein